jgi:beta-galactosidase/beta-glucuronidase
VSRRISGLVLIFAALPALAQLPEGVKAVWDTKLAYHETTPTRERISINGLWRWQPGSGHEIPAADWGYLRVPQPWPGNERRGAPASRFFYPNAAWSKTPLRNVTSAWYQREITAPAEWSGRRITLQVNYLNSYAEVYLDGKRAGEMRFPAGEIDVTPLIRPGRTQLISILVVAMPLKAVMLSYNDSANARTVEGNVARKGLCGDIYLASEPSGPRISNVHVDTSVRKWQIEIGVNIEALDPKSSYRLRTRVFDGENQVREFSSRTFQVADLDNGRFKTTEGWHPAKLWDINTPQNQYRLVVTLLDAGAKQLDVAAPQRFGFRELWINGRDFYLNGTRIYLSALPIDNAQGTPLTAGYHASRATMQYFKSFGINFIYTHNYSCEPGTHLAFEDLLRAADDEGMLVSFSQPHFSAYDWTAPDADRTNGYAQHAAFYVRVAQNHPSVVFYSMSHNATGYSEDMNPDMIDGIHEDRDQWATRNKQRALRAEAIVTQLDPARIVYHHASGNLGPMHVSNFYGNWIPIQEMSDWFQHWADTGIKPLFTCEYSVPFLWDWAMYRGWYKGKREFGSAVVPWDYEIAEWDAQFLGDRAYQITEAEKNNLRWEAKQVRAGKVWYRWDYPESLNSQAFDDRFEVIGRYISDNYRAFRTLGVSATSPWEYGSYWKKPAGKGEPEDLPIDIDWDYLQRPGPAPEYVDGAKAAGLLAFRAADYEPTAAARAIYRNNESLLGYIAGKSEGFTGKDHNFLPGDKLEKQLIVINNTRAGVKCDMNWTLRLPTPVSGSSSVTLATGQQERIRAPFHLPANLASGRYELHATFNFSTGVIQEDSFFFDVLPAPAALQIKSKVALFDPRGDTARLLDRIGIRYQSVSAGQNLDSFDILIVGKAAITLDAPAPDITRVRNGLKVIVFEQTGEVLEQRFGFRVAEYGLRNVFTRIPDHPLVGGITAEELRDWRGASTILPPRLKYEKIPQFNLVPTVKWAGIPVTRVWRNGNRGDVASALIEKPGRGDFLPIIDGGYSLQYSPLLQYREGFGMVLFCQMDVTARTEADPAADKLVRNILRYTADWRPRPARAARYTGDSAGIEYLKKAGFQISPDEGGAPAPDVLLIAGPGAKIPANSAPHILSLGADRVPGVTIEAKEHIAAYFVPQSVNSPFAGISPADVYNRDPRPLPLVVGGGTILGDGVLAIAGNAVFSQMPPWQFTNQRRTFRRAAFQTARLLSNLGVPCETPLLGNFSHPAAASSERWLESYYLDAPEEWDDPYRFFRW